MSLLFLRDHISWFGSHTGYEVLTRFVANGRDCSVIAPRRGQMARYLGSAYARLQGRSGRGAASLSQLEFRVRRRLRRPDASHILYLENHFDLLRSSTTNKELIGTIHLPSKIWQPEQCALLSRMKSALVLYQRDIPFFEQYVGKGRVRFIHHGADTEFFKPDPAKLAQPPRILYSGVYLRNEPMLARVAKRLAELHPELHFDLLVPKHHRKSPALEPLLNHPSVTWHAGLNDEQLRELYQASHLMLLPMNDSGANTAVVEALASGLPLATTDVGGIRDYGGGSIFPLVSNDDDDAMVKLVERYIADPEWRDETSRNCRQFAERELAWPLVARKHMELYQELLA